jgi:IS5 family transposase
VQTTQFKHAELMNHTDKLVEIFVRCDDFYKHFEKFLQAKAIQEPMVKPAAGDKCRLSQSEIMTIVIFYHVSGFKCFKYYYEQGMLKTWKSYFPDAVSYNRFIEVKKRSEYGLVLLHSLPWTGYSTGNYFIDSTKMPVCDNHRIHSHKVFRDVAARGKTSTGWFYGLKLHLIINEQGELMSVCFTGGNVSDNNGAVVQRLCQALDQGAKIFADAGYVSQKLFEALYEQGWQLITKIRRNMKNKLLLLKDKFMLKRRSLIETVINLLKCWLDLWHTRHRSVDNAFNNMLACLAAYSFLDKKPCIKQKLTPFAIDYNR